MAAWSSDQLIVQARARLRAHIPVPHPEDEARAAAVAVVVRPDGDDAQVLFIKRAEYELDPWSGQIAFPGGRQEPGDGDLLETAVRETFEEIGLDLREAELLGRLDDLHSRNVKLPNLFVRPFVFAVTSTFTLQLSSEVADAFWVPFSLLRQDESWQPTTVKARGLSFDVRACNFEGRVIWGMTERILSQLLEVAFAAR